MNTQKTLPEGCTPYDLANWQLELARQYIVEQPVDLERALGLIAAARKNLADARKAEGTPLATIEEGGG
ncbi:MAG TPA: hypothetical protein VK550_36060 [Polyangiaceae bacterium]|nr:hypothetical protein [Polyangiaceae bacterium]